MPSGSAASQARRRCPAPLSKPRHPDRRSPDNRLSVCQWSGPDPRRACPSGSRRARPMRICARRRPHPGRPLCSPRLANARRSRFCAVMYSSACQRVSRLIRLPTLALPATAPIDLSPNHRVRRAMVSGSKWVSASRATTTSPCEEANPDIDGSRLAAVADCDERHSRIAPEAVAHDIAGAVGRPVIDDDDLEVCVAALENSFHRAGDDLGLVEGGN